MKFFRLNALLYTGFAYADDKQRLAAFIRRSIRQGFCAPLCYFFFLILSTVLMMSQENYWEFFGHNGKQIRMDSGNAKAFTVDIMRKTNSGVTTIPSHRPFPLPSPSPFLPAFPFFLSPSLFPSSPLFEARGSGEALKFPQRVRAEPGRQAWTGHCAIVQWHRRPPSTNTGAPWPLRNFLINKQ